MAGERFRLTRIADAFATMMCPILLLRLLKKAARLEWTVLECALLFFFGIKYAV